MLTRDNGRFWKKESLNSKRNNRGDNMKISKVGVVGCGLMGSGIIEASILAGYNVIVSEVNKAALDTGLTNIRKSMARAVERRRLEETEMKAALARLQSTLSYDEFSKCQLVIEAATENLELKKEIFAQLDKACPPDTILASNTSCLSIVDMAIVTGRLERVLGMHFFNPVRVMKLMELVRSILTSDETIKAAREFGESIGKTVIIAPDTPGFVVDRLLIPYLLDAIRIFEAGVAGKEDIDQGMVLGCNHPMGPLTLADLIGLDTVLYVADAMYEEFKAPSFASPPLLRKMVTANQLGRKTKKGFYSYD
jgi:3-hydroxybutyryl-CoA dehydrogenase